MSSEYTIVSVTRGDTTSTSSVSKNGDEDIEVGERVTHSPSWRSGSSSRSSIRRPAVRNGSVFDWLVDFPFGPSEASFACEVKKRPSQLLRSSSLLSRKDCESSDLLPPDSDLSDTPWKISTYSPLPGVMLSPPNAVEVERPVLADESVESIVELASADCSF